MELTVLYRDGLCIVLDKPAGLPVHPEPGGRGPNLLQFLPDLKLGRPSPAHRLDRDTTGCLALGRHPKALRKLGELFAEGQVEKVYWALVGGEPADEGEIDQPLAEKDARGRVRVDPQGKPARTRYRVLRREAGRTWLELRPETGRTHQLRVHLAWLGCAIVGDERYGGGKAAGMALHSRSLRLPLYPKREAIYVEAPAPAWWGLGC